jgi:hypothetical protein
MTFLSLLLSMLYQHSKIIKNLIHFLYQDFDLTNNCLHFLGIDQKDQNLKAIVSK